jgi:hypothetical protein
MSSDHAHGGLLDVFSLLVGQVKLVPKHRRLLASALN